MPEFTVPVHVEGTLEVSVTAETPEEAARLANEQAEEADFGPLQDIDWEVKIPIRM